MLQGTTFLLNMAVMLNAGIRPYDSLASMIKISPPWLKQRLEAARYGVGLGQNLGLPFAAPVTISPTTGHPVPVHPRQPGRLLRSAVKFSRRWQETTSSRSSWPPGW
ncbi:type II secretion system F family protein [Pseudomonas aeruginosa]|uniref:type II secretion system F family protein n=1 Tax=Pseudomonas aeruginosa TaxID=287 RepID=UPI000B0A220A|nr:type II secretion system F family protein [Pseudomonas aeruginosa]